MQLPPLPTDEKERIQDLYDLKLLDTEPEERFDRYIRIARRTFNMPVAFISLIDVKRQWFKACEGLSVSETSRDISFCAYTILTNQPMIIADLCEDARFANNPLVKGPPYIRFYAGYPLRGPRGHRVGSFCIIDFVPRQISSDSIKMLGDMALMVSEEVNHTIGSNRTQRFPLQVQPIQPDESERLQDLYAVALLDTPHEERFDRFVDLARDTFKVPVVLLSLIDAKRVWFKASYGISMLETARNATLCAYTILTDEPLIIPDMLEHARFANHPLVTGNPFIRFYAGYSLHGPSGKRIGSFCLIDFAPRVMSHEDLEIFHGLAQEVEREMQLTIGHTSGE